MLETLTNFFDWLVGIVTTLFDFLGSIIAGLINIVTSIPLVIDMLTKSIGYLPSTIAAFATITITISVVYLIVGRNTGG